jgi:hypothetical protein
MFGIEPSNATARCPPSDVNGRAHRRAARSHPVGVPAVFAATNPGFRCAPPWAMEFGPFGADGLRPRRRPKHASFQYRTCDARIGRPRTECAPCHVTTRNASAPRTEGATFHSPGCNPGFRPRATIVALKGRHSPRTPTASNRATARMPTARRPRRAPPHRRFIVGPVTPHKPQWN